MKIVLISDLHGKHDDLTKLLPPTADMIICAGDISMFGNMNTINSFIYWFSNLDQYKYKIFIAGNHDRYFEDHHYLALTMIPENVIYLENSGVTINGVYIYGSPIQPTFFNWAFNVDRGEPIKKYWDMIPDHTDILVTHGPPYGVLDASRFNQDSGTVGDAVNHAGCEELSKAVFDRVKPSLHLFGHIHPGYGKIKKEEIWFVNASNVDEKYMIANKPILINIDENTKKVKVFQ